MCTERERVRQQNRMRIELNGANHLKLNEIETTIYSTQSTRVLIATDLCCGISISTIRSEKIPNWINNLENLA